MDWQSFIRPHVHPMVPYAPGLRGSEVRERTGAAEVLKLSSNESSYGPFPRAAEAGRAVIEHLNRYPDGSARDLKSALSEQLGVATEELVVGNGSNEILIRLAQAVAGPGDEIVYGWPSFIVYRIACQLTGATGVEVPLDENDRYDLDGILAAITYRTKVIYLCNPNNPTGTVYERDAFAAFMDAVPDNVLVVIDEAYFEFVTDESYPNGFDWYDGVRPVFVLRTFSKAYSLAGARVGYGAMPRPMVEALDKIREPFNVNTVAQAMAYYSLGDSTELARRVGENAAQRGRLIDALRAVGVRVADSQTNFVWAHLPNAAGVFEALLAEGVIVRSFGPTPALRFGVGTQRETDRMVEVIEKLAGRGLFAG